MQHVVITIGARKNDYAEFHICYFLNALVIPSEADAKKEKQRFNFFWKKTAEIMTILEK
jgi:hypothetical protein